MCGQKTVYFLARTLSCFLFSTKWGWAHEEHQKPHQQMDMLMTGVSRTQLSIRMQIIKGEVDRRYLPGNSKIFQLERWRDPGASENASWCWNNWTDPVHLSLKPPKQSLRICEDIWCSPSPAGGCMCEKQMWRIFTSYSLEIRWWTHEWCCIQYFFPLCNGKNISKGKKKILMDWVLSMSVNCLWHWHVQVLQQVTLRFLANVVLGTGRRLTCLCLLVILKLSLSSCTCFKIS